MNELTGKLDQVCELPMADCIVYRVLIEGQYYNTNSTALRNQANALVGKLVRIKWFDLGHGRFRLRFIWIGAADAKQPALSPLNPLADLKKCGVCNHWKADSHFDGSSVCNECQLRDEDRLDGLR